jgi:uncharacterized membrane protein SpoIIM required for sporulation
MTRYGNLYKRVIKCLRHFAPSKYSFLIFILFYLSGLIFAILKPQYAASTFYYGFFLGVMKVKIQLPDIISLNYLSNQFIYYLGRVSFSIFLNNVKLAIFCVFMGVAIVPIMLVGLFAYSGSLTGVLVMKFGIFKSILILLGSFHLPLEILAAILSIDAFLKFYGSIINSILKRDFAVFKTGIKNEFLPLILKIIIVLAIAAVLEVFWSTWWVYILTNPYVSWYDFYFGVSSVTIN